MPQAQSIERFARVMGAFNGSRGLTAVEMEVAYLSTVEGMTVRQVALSRHRQPSTIERQRESIRVKLSYRNWHDCALALHAAYHEQVGYEKAIASMDRVKVA